VIVAQAAAGSTAAGGAAAGGMSTTALVVAGVAVAAAASSSSSSSTPATAAPTAAPTSAPTPAPTPAAQTLILSSSIDSVLAGSGDDTIIGDFSGTASAADQINGGAGTDTLKLYGAYDSTKMPITVTNVERLALVNPGANDVSLSAIGYTKAATGISVLQVDQANATGGKAYTVGTGQSYDLATAANAASGGTLTLNYAATATSGDLALSGYQGGTGVTADATTVAGTVMETLNISTKTAASRTGTLTLPATLTKLNLSGDQSLTVGSTAGATSKLTTIDGSGSTGALTLTVDYADAALKVTGGSGNDVILFGTTNTFTTADSVDGGAGVNTLGLARTAYANKTTAYTNISNIQTIRVVEAPTASDIIDLSMFGSAAQNVEFGSSSAAIASTATTFITNAKSGSTLSLSATGTTNIALGTDGTSDVLNLKFTAGTSQTYTVTATGYETLNLDASGITTAGTLALTDAQLKTLVVTNTTSTGTNPDATLALGTLGSVVSTVDLSAWKAATASKGVTVALSNAAINGATITGTANADTITASSQADTISAGGGADTITTGGGADVLTLGAGLDTVITTGITTGITITDLVGGSTSSSRDLVQLDISDIEAITGVGNLSNGNSGDISAAASVVKALSAAGTLGATDSIIVLAGETYSSVAAFKTAISAGGSRAVTLASANAAGDAQVFVYSDGTNAHLVAVKDAGTATSYTASNLTVTEIVTLNGFTSLTATTFAAGNFEFIA